MLVTSELDLDPRVQKQALFAHEAGWEVTVVCRSYNGPEMPYRVQPVDVPRRELRIAKYAERAWLNLRMLREAVRSRARVLHANDLDTLPAGHAASRITGAKLVYDAHEVWCARSASSDNALPSIALHIEKYVSRRAAAVTTVSAPIAAYMADVLGITEPTVVMNTPRYVAAENEPQQSWRHALADKRVVLHQGHYRPDRGLEETVMAAKYFPDDAVLVFRGCGAIEQKLRDLVKSERLDDRVIFLPYLPVTEVVNAAVGADLGLVLYAAGDPNNQFAAPNKLFEYIMAGVPCVGSDMPFIRHILISRGLGRVCRPGDTEDIARLVNEMLNDPDELQNMKRRCFEAARELCWEREGSNLLGEYERLATIEQVARA